MARPRNPNRPGNNAGGGGGGGGGGQGFMSTPPKPKNPNKPNQQGGGGQGGGGGGQGGKPNEPNKPANPPGRYRNLTDKQQARVDEKVASGNFSGPLGKVAQRVSTRTGGQPHGTLADNKQADPADDTLKIPGSDTKPTMRDLITDDVSIAKKTGGMANTLADQAAAATSKPIDLSTLPAAGKASDLLKGVSAMPDATKVGAGIKAPSAALGAGKGIPTKTNPATGAPALDPASLTKGVVNPNAAGIGKGIANLPKSGVINSGIGPTPDAGGMYSDVGPMPEADSEMRTQMEGQVYDAWARDAEAQFAQEGEDFEQEMANRGIPPGSEQYNRLKEQMLDTQNEARMDAKARAVEMAGSEMERQYGMQMEAYKQKAGQGEKEFAAKMDLRKQLVGEKQANFENQMGLNDQQFGQQLDKFDAELQSAAQRFGQNSEQYQAVLQKRQQLVDEKQATFENDLRANDQAFSQKLDQFDAEMQTVEFQYGRESDQFQRMMEQRSAMVEENAQVYQMQENDRDNALEEMLLQRQLPLQELEQALGLKNASMADIRRAMEEVYLRGQKRQDFRYNKKLMELDNKYKLQQIAAQLKAMGGMGAEGGGGGGEGGSGLSPSDYNQMMNGTGASQGGGNEMPWYGPILGGISQGVGSGLGGSISDWFRGL